MSAPASPGPQPSRDAAVAEWEKEVNRSIVAAPRRKRAAGLGVGAAAIAAMGLVWYFKHSSAAQESPRTTDLTIPEGKAVPNPREPGATAPRPSPAPPRPEAPAPVPSVVAGGPTIDQSAQLEAQRLENERRMREARLKSAIVPPGTVGQFTVSPNAGSEPIPSQSPGDRGAQDPNSRFARAVAGQGVPVSKAGQIGDLDYKVLQGKLIEAVLVPRANSDLPGTLCALVQTDVYGSQGRIPLIPWGSRVCGVYSAEIRKGQDRIFAVWNTLRRPDGVEVAIDSVGADQLGTVGMGGEVDTHFAQIFGISALLSIIGAGAANVGVNQFSQQNSADYYRTSVQQAAAQTSQQVLQPYASMPPTIISPAGSRIRIFVNRDLDFTPVYQAQIDSERRAGVTFIE